MWLPVAAGWRVYLALVGKELHINKIQNFLSQNVDFNWSKYQSITGNMKQKGHNHITMAIPYHHHLDNKMLTSSCSLCVSHFQPLNLIYSGTPI